PSPRRLARHAVRRRRTDAPKPCTRESLMTTTTHETEIYVDPMVPLVRITRDFDAAPAKVFRAYTDPELVQQWLGPRRHEMVIDHYDCWTGGSYRYLHVSDGNE